MTDKPFWWPVPTDAAWGAQMRVDYPENAAFDDELMRQYYNHGRRYETPWDHIGEAYEEYEPLADLIIKGVWVLAIEEGMDGPGVWLFTTREAAQAEFMNYFTAMFEDWESKTPIPTKYVDYIIDDWMREEGEPINYSILFRPINFAAEED